MRFMNFVIGCLLIGIFNASTWGLETDQFTTPKKPLPDIGPQLSEYVHKELQKIIAQTQKEYKNHKAKLANKEVAAWDKLHHRHQMKQIRNGNRLIDLIYDRMGKGLIESTVGAWLRTVKVGDKKAHFDVGYGDSVFGLSVIRHPLLLRAVAPTVNIYGVYMGTDKIDHFFAQGWDYHEKCREALRDGAKPAEALKAAIKHGKQQEKSYYGLWPAGTYSNADLAADYAGYKFLLNLTQPVKVGKKTVTPVLIWKKNTWTFNPKAGKAYLKPFMSHHFNEAMNPNWYDGSVRGFVRSAVRKRYKTWLKFYKTTPEAEAKRVKQLATWHGEDYGHRGFADVITISNVLAESE